jgi:hypothetical protein
MFFLLPLRKFFFLLRFASVFFFSLRFASVFFISLHFRIFRFASKRKYVGASFRFKIFLFPYFCFVFSFRFFVLICFAFLASYSFPFVLLVKSTVSLQTSLYNMILYLSFKIVITSVLINKKKLFSALIFIF